MNFKINFIRQDLWPSRPMTYDLQGLCENNLIKTSSAVYLWILFRIIIRCFPVYFSQQIIIGGLWLCWYVRWLWKAKPWNVRQYKSITACKQIRKNWITFMTQGRNVSVDTTGLTPSDALLYSDTCLVLAGTASDVGLLLWGPIFCVRLRGTLASCSRLAVWCWTMFEQSS